MLYAILCYNSEAVVGAWTKEEDDAVMAEHAVVMQELAAQGKLGPVGVDPIYQGKGFGSALMQHALNPCDRDDRLAYLESTNPRNIPLYERHGFELLGTIQVGTSPPLFPMLRKPKGRDS